MSPVDQATEYIIYQTKNNVQFLQSINKISPEDARQILSKLPGPDRNLEVRQSSPSSANFRPISPRPGASNYRALWSYNENGQEVKDLAFNAGDVIQVIDKSNSGWWVGRLNGREGPFPASYVEIVLDSPQRFQELPSPPQHGNFRTGPHPYPQQPQYYGPPVGNMYPSNPISFQGGSGPYSLPPGPPPGTVVVMNTEQSPKKNGFLSGDLGNTLAHSAVGGVGFGAGSAIAGGIINSIL